MLSKERLATVVIPFLILIGGTGALLAETPEDTVKHFEFSSYQQADELMVELNYTPETWQAGIREIPRLFLTEIPPRWRDQTTQEVSVVHKKRLFFRALAPLALRSNELILANRERAQEIIADLRAGGAPSETDSVWLGDLATTYDVSGDAITNDDARNELLLRVDCIPVSLVLSQAAEESGWGTSRFASQGNALFGQWTWSGKGITPEQQRSHLGDYKIAAFETPLQSVMAYMQNLNTHRAYSELREYRARLRRKGVVNLSGSDLTSKLGGYSERGQAYVDSLNTIMRVNKLLAADEAYLADGPTILLFPAGEGSGSE